MTKKELLAKAENMGDDDVVVATIWCTDDVMVAAKDMSVKITKKDARKILADIDANQDCNFGISWVTIYAGVRSFAGED